MASTTATDRLVLAPDALIRIRDGQFLVHGTAGGTGLFRTGSPGLLAWIGSFSRPQSRAESLARVAPQERTQVEGLIDRLREAGILLSTEAAEVAGDDEAEHARSSRLLAALANETYALASDLRGFGPWAHGRVRERSGLPVTPRIESLLNGVTQLRRDLAMLREAFLGEQMTRLGIAPSRVRGLKLHLGSGGHDLDGWLNVDVHPAPLALNLDWGLPLADGSVSFVFLSHLFEHLFYPQQAMALLAELHRVLAPGGVVRIIVPDIEQAIAAYVDDDRRFFEDRRQTWQGWPEGGTRLEDFLAYAGAGPEPGLLFESHKFGYDFQTLSRALERSGFVGARRCGYQGSPHPELRHDDASEVAGATYGDRHFSLFVEAEKPATGAQPA
jgi:hypothetical protein